MQIPDRTEWHNIIAWRGLADLAEKYIKKGAQLYIEGKIRTRSWDDQSGVKHYVTEIYADTIQLLGSRPADNAASASKPQNGASTPGVNVQQNIQNAMESTNDDLPF